MRPTLNFGDPREALKGTEDQLSQAITGGMTEATDGLKQELRDQIEAAGLGPRLARTIRSRIYPVGATSSLNPAGYVWTKAPRIVDAFNRGATIFPTGGKRYLAIPSDNVPMKGRGRVMTPFEVEVSFNQDLIIRRNLKGNLLAFVNVVAAKNRRGYRRATPGRLAQGRDVKLVLMFTLVRSVSLRKRLDIKAAGERWAARLPEIIARRWR